MRVEGQSCPSVLVPLTGLGMVGLAIARLGIGPGPGGPWLALPVGVAGAGLAAWGVGRLRRAKAASPSVSWWGLLRGQVATLAIAAALLPVGTAIPKGQQDEFLRTAREWFELVHAARGQ